MARHVHLELERTERAAGGAALAAAVLLRVRGVTVLDWRLVELAPSALALARAAAADHGAGAAGEIPLFGDADFSVAHEGDTVRLSDFRGCDAAPDGAVSVPWSALAGAMIRLGDYTVRRSAGAPGEGWREELRERLRPIRARRRALVRAAPRER